MGTGNTEEALRRFPGRTQDLRAIVRYNLYPVMFYRTNLLLHSQRVAWIMDELNLTAERVFGAGYDTRRARVLSLVHDDAEIVMGDIQAGNKGNMTATQLAEVDDFTHESLESQVVQFADKFDAFGEALHEVFAGNRCFVTNVVNEYGRIPTPVEYYLAWFPRYLEKFPKMAPLLASENELVRTFPDIDWVAEAERGSLHDEQSFRRPSGYWPYDLWKQITLKNADGQQMRAVLESIEGLNGAG
jgi:5'-deoxynucleotidase YfbR-like HD superfamily hydrolase